MTKTTISAADIDAVCFDCFGTLLSVAEGPYAYRRLVGAAGDRRAMRHQVLTAPRSFEVHAAGAGWDAREIAGARVALEEELASIAVLDDAPRVLEALRAKGLKIALCSNLATEFGPAALRALGFLFDTTVLSYEVGLTKPDEAIYRTVCRNLGCAPARVLMVGDSQAADIDGARSAGLHALRIHRNPATAQPDDLRHLAQLAERL
jgi:HAD superfamily hydrolase (TIGR01509 family)